MWRMRLVHIFNARLVLQPLSLSVLDDGSFAWGFKRIKVQTRISAEGGWPVPVACQADNKRLVTVGVELQVTLQEN
ncbi:uncharacterized protein B0I36DRAFT_333355 [Microdochium trichocladiopsis]|uniref:Uncharacterized protein n=1 Tax=Microdochium trichocladiopsis TaxID=1682393 RepID=A0A9P8XVU9_9PEZI|nr:uncharacterized protein B0I36DRAFT_333355 [Microdochium trichocladiopsis]KAH7020887.1 hypothetical protein B0I36DRAFT_333355 [Microdochium trichocladiopsis]